MLSAIALSAVIVISPPVTTSTIPRIRPLSDGARQVVEEAARRSPTIARLLRIIEQSDAIVYVQLQFDLRGEGATSLMAVNGQCRFIRVAIGRTLTGYRRIEILGHELQHAVEIILAPEVRDSSSLRRLFSRIGWLLTDVSFESGEAIDVERRVRFELRPALAQSKRQKS
ncbi:MAG TPA: hypothetical protein VES67_01230 [Vicinamibacterales bacterium]|nr:hypothetical protein [Vicinamibacterales bacterium]